MQTAKDPSAIPHQVPHSLKRESNCTLNSSVSVQSCLNDKTSDGRQGARQRVQGPGIELLAPTTNSNAPTRTAESASNFVHELDKLPDTG